MNKIPMTKAGADALRQELHQLKTVDRQRIIDAIAEARAHGDLKENAEYHAAREQQGFVEGRIREIEAKLSSSQIIDVTKMNNEGKVIFGATVKVLNTDDGQASQYQIVGEDEADIKVNKISVTSPISRALIGKFEGDVVDEVRDVVEARHVRHVRDSDMRDVLDDVGDILEMLVSVVLNLAEEVGDQNEEFVIIDSYQDSQILHLSRQHSLPILI